ncbi:DNA replication complex GINS protein PSF2 [Camellia lanceoleosa]|uniref:DNA replication complex GINS protein PSF2 n=1 Tax=Camellia lanceoleosa TaxID=1840588 RepID=A0ACC0GZQ8_9ERIC|nr:DNA replication complex GINS protein PSF2 [Camellia lanceoleosa]
MYRVFLLGHFYHFCSLYVFIRYGHPVRSYGSEFSADEGDFGPLHPQIPTQVPLWLAVALKKRGKCTIRPLEWMSVEKLTQVLEAERDSQKTFQRLPFHYVEISRLLFDHARDNIADIYMVRSLIEDIKDVRFHKIGTGLEVISQRTAALKLEHLTAMEVNIVRPFVVRALQTLYKLDSPEIIQELDLRANRRFLTANHGPKRPLKR